MELQDDGSFFVNATTSSSHPGTSAFSAPQPGTITTRQMYVQYRIPKTVSGPAIVMVHGSGHTGATYETTPDGREGWATYFARKGFPVYVVDHSGRGRSGFDPTPINRARAEANAAALPDIQIAPVGGVGGDSLFISGAGGSGVLDGQAGNDWLDLSGDDNGLHGGAACAKSSRRQTSPHGRYQSRAEASEIVRRN